MTFITFLQLNKKLVLFLRKHTYSEQFEVFTYQEKAEKRSFGEKTNKDNILLIECYISVPTFIFLITKISQNLNNAILHIGGNLRHTHRK